MKRWKKVNWSFDRLCVNLILDMTEFGKINNEVIDESFKKN